MTTRVHDNLMKGAFFFVLFLVLLLQSLLVQAQSFGKSSTGKPYKGFTASFGTRSATVKSTIGKLDQASLVQAGGQVGVVYGNELVRARLNVIGYYSSTGAAAGSTDLYTSNAGLNFYPLSLLSGGNLLINPYLTASLDYDRYKFFGYYINQEPGTINYSQTEAPYLGQITQINSTLGLGVEVNLKNDYDFIHIFSELRYGNNLSASTTKAAFSQTQITGQTQVVVGVSFGIHR